MNTIEFDGTGNCVIYAKDSANEISFLMMDAFFNNSLEKLRGDIEECDDITIKQRLIKFRELHTQYFGIQSGETEAVNGNPEICNIELKSSDTGSRNITINNIAEPEHSGFWYACHDLTREIESISVLKHNLEGCALILNDIDSIISLIRISSSTEEALAGLMARGLDKSQSNYILSLPLNRFVELGNSPITIAKCERMLHLIQKIED